MTIKTYSTRANARRALSKICAKCVQHAKELITEVDGKFVFDEDKVEELMTRDEWLKAYGDTDSIRPSDEKEVGSAMDDMPDPTDVEEMRAEAASTVYGFETHGLMNCPHCGIHLSNGIGTDYQDVNGKIIRHDAFEFACLACGGEFGPAISKSFASKTGKPHDAQKTCMKLDRTIYCVETRETWKNAHAMWVANPKFMTSAQQDRLTKKLYEAAKEGRREIVKVGDLNFYLVNVAGCNPMVEE